MKLTQLIETKERLYVCVHAKTPKHEVYAKSSYDAAKQAAEYWGMKSTAGIDAHLAEDNQPEPRKMQVTQADKDNNTEAWKRFRAGDPRYEWKDMILSKKEGDVSEAVGEFAQPIYDLIDDLGGDNDAHEIVLNDLVRYLGGDTIQDFVKDFRSNHDMYGEDDKNFESVKEATHGEAKPIYDLVGSLGAGDIELAQNPIFQDLVRFLDADTINKFVTDFRRKMAKDKDFKGSVDFGQYKESFNDEEYNDEERAGMEYTVWVGGTEVNDKWLNYEEAKELYDLWRAKGYDDVQLDARLKEGSFWGRDDMVAQMKRDELAAGMRKYTKDVDGVHSGSTTSDPEEWERLEADGYEWDKDYYKDIEELEARWKKKHVKEDDGLIKRQDGKYDQADIAHGKDDGKLRLDPATGKYDPDEIRAMQYQQNVSDPLNREIDASQKAITIEVDYDLELDKPKSKNPLLKKHYKEMRKFNVFISMPEWQEGPPDSGFGIWTAKVRGSKKNLLGWLKAWEFDYDKEQLADMGLGESVKEEKLDELLPALAVGAMAAKAVGGIVGAGAKAVGNAVTGSVNASKKSKKGKKKLNAVKEKEEKTDDLLKGFDPRTERALMMLKAKYPQADNILSALLADVENNEKDSDVADLTQGHKINQLSKAIEILQKEINLLKGDKKLNAVKEKAKPDFLDLDKDGNKKEPMKKAVKDKKKVSEDLDAVSKKIIKKLRQKAKDDSDNYEKPIAKRKSDKEIIKKLRQKAKDDSDNYEKPIAKRKSDKELIKKLRQDADDDIKARDKRNRKRHPEWFEAYNPETGRDPNKPTPEWDNLIAKAKKKQGISDEEEVWFNYEDIGGNIIVNPKSTIEDQIGELLNRYYDISPMEFDPSKIEITTPDQTNQDANFAKTQNARNTPVQEDKYSDLNPTNKFGYFGGPGFYSNNGSTYTEPHYDDFDIRQHNRDNPEDKIKLNNWADFNLKMRYHKKDGKRVQGFGGMGYNVSFHGNPKDVEAFAMQHLDAERYSGDNIPESESLNASHESLASSLIASRQAKRNEVKKVREDEEAVAARDEFMKVMDMRPKGGLKDIPKAIDTIKKIVADKQNQQVKFDDGKMRVDLYTASAVSKVYDAVKPETQEKIDDMLRTKEGMLKMSNFAFSKLSEGIKAGKRADEVAFLAPLVGVAGGIARAGAMAATRVAPAVGQVAKKVAKAAIKHPIKTAAVVHTLKGKDKTATQKASKIARITGGMPSTNPRKYEVESDALDELQAPYTGADAVIDKKGKGHKPGSPKANMIINMKKKAPVVAKPLQNKTANTSGVKPAQSTVKPAGVGRGNAPGSKATQIQPGGGSQAGKQKLKVSGKTKAIAALGTAKHLGSKAKGFIGHALSKAADKSGFGNPLSASEYSPEDKAVDIMKGAMKKVEELSPTNLKPAGKITVKRIPAKGPKGYTPGDHHPPTKFKAKVQF